MRVCFIVFVVSLLALSSPGRAGEPLPLFVKSKAAVLVNAKTGRVLYAKNAGQQLPPASTTKVATALYILTHHSDHLKDMVLADGEPLKMVTSEALERSGYSYPAYWLITDGSHMGIKKGEIISVQDLLQGLLIRSGNDAANVLAAHFAPSIPDFMVEVNSYLKEIGCQHTTFVNPHGIYNPAQKTTAYDLAVMTCAALEIPAFREIVKAKVFSRPPTNKQAAVALRQTNQLMIPSSPYYYPKAIGVKTGFTSQVGYNLVAAAEQDGRTLVAVVLGGNKADRYQDTIQMFQAAFEQEKTYRELIASGALNMAIPVEGGDAVAVPYLNESVMVSYYPAEEPTYDALVEWSELVAPIIEGQQIGKITFESDDGTFHRVVPIYAKEAVSPTLAFATAAFAKKYYMELAGGALALLLILLWMAKRRH